MVTAAQLIFTGLVRVTNSFFYSVGKDKYSLFMIYFDPLIMTPLTIVILPRILGLDGIWITAVVTQFILNIVAFGMFASHERQMKRMEARSCLQENEKDKRNRTVDRYMKKNVTKMAGTPSELRSFSFP